MYRISFFSQELFCKYQCFILKLLDCVFVNKRFIRRYLYLLPGLFPQKKQIKNTIFNIKNLLKSRLKDASNTILLKSVSFYLQRIVLQHVQPHNSRTFKGVKIQSFISIADMSVKH